MGLGDTILEGNNESAQNKAKAIMIIRHHIQEELKNEYLTIKNPLIVEKFKRKIQQPKINGFAKSSV